MDSQDNCTKSITLKGASTLMCFMTFDFHSLHVPIFLVYNMRELDIPGTFFAAKTGAARGVICRLYLCMCQLKLLLLISLVQCNNAIAVGRSNRAGFAEIGKVYARMAKASVKMGDKEQAISYLEDAQVKYSRACILWHFLEYPRASKLDNGLVAY